MANWTFTEFATPTKNGDYLVAAMVPDLGGNGKEKRHIFINEYCQLKGFQFDNTMEMRCDKPRVYAWCEIPELPRNRGK